MCGERLRMREINSEKIHTKIIITISEEKMELVGGVGRMRMVPGDYCFVLLISRTLCLINLKINRRCLVFFPTIKLNDLYGF